MARKGEWSKPFDSLTEAVEWLQSTCYKKADKPNISECLNEKRKTKLPTDTRGLLRDFTMY
jgi:hypothetical protein